MSSIVKSLYKDIYFLLILVLILGLFLYKFQDLFLPYFSDELWSYGPAIRKMSVFGPSLLPSSLELTDHWAHPLFFFFLASIWSSIFGASLFSTHFFSALLSSILLMLIFIVVKQLMNRRIAFYSTVIIAFQSIFLGQYSLLLPEILLTIFTFLAIYFFESGKLKWYVLTGVCLVLTKESGVFPLLAIGLWSLLKDIFYEKPISFTKSLLIKYIALLLPFFAILGHFILLKIEYGWYIMPLRANSFDFSWDIYHERLMSTIHYLFIDQGRKVITIILFFIGILFYPKLRWIYKIIIVIVSFCLMKMFFGYWKTAEYIEYLIIPIVFIIIVKLLFIDVYKKDKKSGGFIAITSILIISYVIFISSFFDSRRYLFFLIPMFIIVVNYYLDQLPTFKQYILPIFSVIIISFSINYIINDKNQGDDTNHYQNMCLIQQEAISYLEEKYNYSEEIHTTFLLRHSLERPLTGYLSSLNKFSNVKSISKIVNCDDCLFIFSSLETPLYYEDYKKNNNLCLVKKFKKRDAWIEIYKN